MRNARSVQILLLVSGLIAAVIGAALLLDPVGFEASAGIELVSDPSLLSEMRAPGGALVASGVVIAMGAFIPDLTFTSMLLSALLYLSYGLARALGIAIDGAPAQTLMVAMILELALGLTCLRALLRFRTSGGPAKA